jgi:hypothetical protein
VPRALVKKIFREITMTSRRQLIQAGSAAAVLGAVGSHAVAQAGLPIEPVKIY